MSQKKQSRNFWIYVLLAVIAAIILIFELSYRSGRTITMHAACAPEEAQQGDTYIYHLYGSRKHVNEIRLEIIRKISEDVSTDNQAAAEQAMEIAGEKIMEIRSSEAVTVAYETTGTEENYQLLVTITVLPDNLTSSDYDYLNANRLILFGTIPWDTVTMQEAAGILSSQDSLTCAFDSDLSQYK